MESQHLLSPQAYLFLTSQHDKLPQKFNKSEYIRRIGKEIARAFETFKIVLDSKEIDPEVMSEFFHPQKIESVLNKLTTFSWNNNIVSDQNGLVISEIMLKHGFKYFQLRYKETRLLSKQINEMKFLIEDLKTIALEEKKEEQKSQILKYKKFLGLPPKIISETHWTALCMVCWVSGSGNDEKDAIKRIRHVKGCHYDKNDPDRCFKIYFPTKKPIPIRHTD